MSSSPGRLPNPLAAGATVVLRNNAGDDLPLGANGSFTFGTALTDLGPFAVTVHAQPTNPNQTCSVTNGSGTLAGTNVTNVSVICVEPPPYLTISDVSALECTGGSTNFVFTITRSHNLSSVTVNASTANAGAVAGSDYTEITNHVATFAPGAPWLLPSR